jgi:peptidoglycan hydrolase CwlO-like protein
MAVASLVVLSGCGGTKSDAQPAESKDYDLALGCLTTMHSAETIAKGENKPSSRYANLISRFELVVRDIADSDGKSSTDIDIDINRAVSDAIQKDADVLLKSQPESDQAIDRLNRDINICSNQIDQLEANHARVGK